MMENNHLHAKTICEVGCGSGEMLRLLQKKMDAPLPAFSLLPEQMLGPGGDVGGSRRAAHIVAELGQDLLGGASGDARDRVEPLKGRGERAPACFVEGTS
jgi:hypothetical protein